MNDQMFTEAIFKIQDGLESVDSLKREFETECDCGWNAIEEAVALNIGLLESLFEDTEGVITYFIFDTNCGEFGRDKPWEDANGVKWYFEHPIDVYDYFG